MCQTKDAEIISKNSDQAQTPKRQLDSQKRQKCWQFALIR